ncbi:hypothetical protein AVEN_224613-1 [Araneus ventricosus]|uniref:Uncharacterized protein n=1 Tax=Araneus ventricosus TaxID=182803 RepID=A0A4Y2NVB2_ARAVE|nr:hypothetical protein AVEN_224613-1 [Araneus ventricosus]
MVVIKGSILVPPVGLGDVTFPVVNVRKKLRLPTQPGYQNGPVKCIWFGYQEISGVLLWDTCIALVVRKSRNHPTIGIDHWGDKRLVVGRMAVRLSSGKKGRRNCTPPGTNKMGVLDIKERRAVKNRLGSLERFSDSRSAEKSCVIISD